MAMKATTATAIIGLALGLSVAPALAAANDIKPTPYTPNCEEERSPLCELLEESPSPRPKVLDEEELILVDPTPPEPTATAVPTATPEPTPVPTEEATEVPTATPTPEPTATPEPTPTVAAPPRVDRLPETGITSSDAAILGVLLLVVGANLVIVAQARTKRLEKT